MSLTLLISLAILIAGLVALFNYTYVLASLDMMLVRFGKFANPLKWVLVFLGLALFIASVYSVVDWYRTGMTPNLQTSLGYAQSDAQGYANTLGNDIASIISSNGTVVDGNGNTVVDNNGNVVNGKVDTMGNVVDARGNVVVDVNGSVVNGNVVDPQGNVVSSKPSMDFTDGLAVMSGSGVVGLGKDKSVLANQNSPYAVVQNGKMNYSMSGAALSDNLLEKFWNPRVLDAQLLGNCSRAIKHSGNCEGLSRHFRDDGHYLNGCPKLTTMAPQEFSWLQNGAVRFAL